MGIRTFTFNGESSDTYGVMITQNESYNAPARAGEMVSIPGRNGAYWHDLGRFENIEVTYKCAIGEGTKADFVDAMSDIRAWLCSPIGYCRLEDDYNPNEYRLAVYKSGLETAEPFVTGAEFEITFDCKPQRFLKSGETATAVASGGTVSNPTLFDAKPLLHIVGYGNIDIGGANISIGDVPIGNVLIGTPMSEDDLPLEQSINTNTLNSGDDINVNGATAIIKYKTSQTFDTQGCWIANTTDCSASMAFSNGGKTCSIIISIDDTSFAKGTSSTQTFSVLGAVEINGTSTTITITGFVKYDGNDTLKYDIDSSTVVTYTTKELSMKAPEIYGYSTKPANPLYIDLDIGEAYKVELGYVASVNNAVNLPAELPTLPSGNTTITYDNTITSFKVVPRWWKV